MGVRARGGYRRRNGILVSDLPPFVATGSGSAGNPQFTGTLLATLQQFTAAGTLAFGGGTDPDNGYTDREPEAGDLFFDASAANDSGTGTEASPFKTYTAVRARTLVDGQHAWFKTGNYTFGQCISGLASGSPGTPITLSAYPGHTPAFVGHASTSDLNAQHALGNCSYWDIRRFSFPSANWGLYLGPRQWDGPECPVENIRLIDCTGTKTTVDSDNSGIFFIDYMSDYIEVIRCNLAGSGPPTSSVNNALIWADRIKHFKAAGNVLDNCNALIYLKHVAAGNPPANEIDIQILYNILRRGTRGVAVCANYARILHNAFDSCPLDVSDDGGDNVTYNRTGEIARNSFLNSQVSIYKSGNVTPDAWLLRSNLYAGSSRLNDNPDGTGSSQDFNTDTDYNAYTSGSSVIRRNGTTRSLAAHKAAFSDQEQHSVAGTISLVGGSSPGATPANWALNTGSVGIGTGEGGVNCGVDASKLLTVN